jgi:ferredoxin
MGGDRHGNAAGGQIMKPRQEQKTGDFGMPSEQITELDPRQFLKLPPPYDDWDDGEMQTLSDDQKTRLEHSLDGVTAIGIPKPASREQADKMVAGFLEGLKKLLTKEDNWSFLQPLMLSMENCVKCQTCNDACPVYTSSGNEDIYRPTFRAEVLRKIVNKYLKPGGKVLSTFRGNDIELTWDTLARLAELSYRCTLCRRCAQACPIGLDNGLITREIRKLFSQQLGINVEELHGSGTVKQLQVGSSTGMNPTALMDIIEFAEEDILERTGLNIKIPIDKEGADYLVMHNAGRSRNLRKLCSIPKRYSTGKLTSLTTSKVIPICGSGRR